MSHRVSLSSLQPALERCQGAVGPTLSLLDCPVALTVGLDGVEPLQKTGMLRGWRLRLRFVQHVTG